MPREPMSDLERAVFEKLLGMFRQARRFLDFPEGEVIHGPNDRALFGFETHFPKQWLVEDFGFTPEEAEWLVSRVHGRQM
jgi:hypothetical protein